MCFKNNFSNVLMVARVAEITLCYCNVSGDLLYHEVLRQCESDGLRFLSRLWLNFIGVQLVYFCHAVFNRYSFTCAFTEIVQNNASYHHTTDCLDRVLSTVFKAPPPSKLDYDASPDGDLITFCGFSHVFAV